MKSSYIASARHDHGHLPARRTRFAGTALTLAVAATAAGWMNQANAQAAGDVVVNVGWFHLAPIDNSDPLTVSALGQSSVRTGTGASVKSSDTGGITINYFLTDNVALEGVFGIPPKMELDGTGSLSRLGQLGSAREWSPTLLLKYYFGKADAKFRPFVGAGGAYVWYSNVKLQPGLASGAFLGSPLLAGSTSADLTSSFAPVLNAGMSYNFNKHWSASFSLSYLFLSTRATLTTQSAVGTVRSETRIKINPLVSFLSVGYKF